MIKMLRLDERLIHGQIATKWSRILNVDRILVANNDAANNEIIKKSLLMAAPSEIKTFITTLDKAVDICNDQRSKDLKILLIVNSPNDLLEITNRISDIEKINIGNYGRIASKVENFDRKTYDRNLYLYDEEVQILKEVISTGIECEVQTIPDDAPKKLKNLI